jgi:sugar porter (SP) family MFS transporter
MIYIVAAVAGIAGLLFGFDEGVIAGALTTLRQQFQISAFAEGLMTAAVPFGALFGALAAGPMAERHGRRTTLLLAAVLFTVGALLAGMITAIWMLTACRLVLGFAVGVAAMVAPLYISESAPAAMRGMLVSIYQLAITLGILGAYVVNFALDDAWRPMFMLGAVPAVALFIGMFFLRDTPRWLISRGRNNEAATALAKLRNSPANAPELLHELNTMQGADQSTPARASWSDLIATDVRPAFVVAIGLFLLQQFSGINAVIYYAPTVFQEAGFDSGSTQVLATMGVGLVNVLLTLAGMALIDRIGRRKLLYVGFAGTAVGLGMIAIGAMTGAQSLDILAVLGLLIYIGSFAASIGPLPWVMMSEVFPSKVRSLAMSATTISNWAFNFLVVFSFPALVASMGLGGVFALYTLACLAGLYFTWKFVPETSGITLEQIEAHLASGLPFSQLQPALKKPVVSTTAEPINAEQMEQLILAVIALSPYKTHLQPMARSIARTAHQNCQIDCAARDVVHRCGGRVPPALSGRELGPQKHTLLTYLEHTYFASPAFLKTVGEWPVGGPRE